MSIAGATLDPLPYQPIKVIDISPYRSSIRVRPTRARSARRIPRQVLTVAAGLAFLLVLAGVASAGAPSTAPFSLGPGHATPPSLVR